MTNFYLSAFPKDPIIRGAVMQSSDSTSTNPINFNGKVMTASATASQPQWQPDSQLSVIAKNLSCTTGKGMLDCLRGKDGNDLRSVLLSTGVQFQPVIDNITVFKDYVKQTREGQTARVPLLVGTNKVCREYAWRQRIALDLHDRTRAH